MQTFFLETTEGDGRHDDKKRRKKESILSFSELLFKKRFKVYVDKL